jgi:DNA polymerase-3 subunit epsilon
MPMALGVEAVQRSFDDLGTPLRDVTFCVVDLETTGGRPEDQITEIGAVKYRGGELLGTFQTLIDPGVAIPPSITVLTGITEAMVLRAPRVSEVLPTFVEFCGDAVLVGHNVGFDTGFLNRALAAAGWPRLSQRVVDTLSLTRRLLGDELPNCRLDTAASRLRLAHRPSHRALDDALATADLLHVLLERAGTIGVLGLDDLLALPTIAGHPQARKLKLTTSLPRQPGVYLFLDRDGRVLYVGKATDLRSRVRSYFSSDRRRKVAQLLRETERIEHLVCPGPLEPEVTELRLIAEHQPRFNRHATAPDRYVYLKLTLGERFPRVAIARRVTDDGGLYLGPISSSRQARLAIDAIEQASAIRRCTRRSPGRGRLACATPCTPAQLGVSACPCSGFTCERDYVAVVEGVRLGLTEQPASLLGPLRDRMFRLAADERFEEAADVRDRAGALAAVLERQQRIDTLRRAGRVALTTNDGARLDLAGGRLAASVPAGTPPTLTMTEAVPDADGPLRKSAVDEVLCVSGWLRRNAPRLRLEAVEGEWSERAVPLPRFEPPRAARS